MKNCYGIYLVNPEGLAIADLCDYYGEGMIITRIKVPEPHRGKGYARELLRQITADADRDQVNLWLEISASGGLNNTQLTSWYRRHGFKDVGGIHKRRPIRRSV